MMNYGGSRVAQNQGQGLPDIAPPPNIGELQLITQGIENLTSKVERGIEKARQIEYQKQTIGLEINQQINQLRMVSEKSKSPENVLNPNGPGPIFDVSIDSFGKPQVISRQPTTQDIEKASALQAVEQLKTADALTGYISNINIPKQVPMPFGGSLSIEQPAYTKEQAKVIADAISRLPNNLRYEAIQQVNARANRMIAGEYGLQKTETAEGAKNARLVKTEAGKDARQEDAQASIVEEKRKDRELAERIADKRTASQLRVAELVSQGKREEALRDIKENRFLYNLNLADKDKTDEQILEEIIKGAQKLSPKAATPTKSEATKKERPPLGTLEKG